MTSKSTLFSVITFTYCSVCTEFSRTAILDLIVCLYTELSYYTISHTKGSISILR